ncbi:MAG: hypothetical protein ACE5ID_07130 [Acidobacteriota bacterium]
MHRLTGLVALALLSILPAGLLEAAPRGRSVPLHGRVTDANGQGVADLPVRVLATRRVLRFLSVSTAPAQAELAATRTDENGFYEIEVPRSRDYDYYFLRFYDSSGFDLVKYALPPDVEITRRLRATWPVKVDEVLEFDAGWEAARRLVDLYGKDSLRGKIIRSLGVPDRTTRTFTPAGVERETWWFDRAGLAYIIEDGVVQEKKSFKPSRESPSIARK